MRCWRDRRHNHDVTVATNAKLTVCRRSAHELVQMCIKCAVGVTVSRPPTDRELIPRSVGGLCRRVGTSHYTEKLRFLPAVYSVWQTDMLVCVLGYILQLLLT